MLKILISCGILLSSAAFAKENVWFIKKSEPGCVHKGVVEGTFGKEIYEKWSMFDVVHLEQPATAMENILKKAAGLGGNRIVITDVRPVYLAIRSQTYGDYASHTTTSLSAVTIQGAVYACN